LSQRKRAFVALASTSSRRRLKRVRSEWTFSALAAVLVTACGGSVANEPAPPDGEARDAGVRDASVVVDASFDAVVIEDAAVEAAIEAGDAAFDSGCGAITPSGSTAVAYQIDPGHSGGQPGDHLSLPLCQRWSVDLGGSVSYPLVAQGLVFVTVGSAADAGGSVDLVALDEHTGAIAWGPIALGGTYPMGHATYENGRIFAVNSDGQLSAFDAMTGTLEWSEVLVDADGGATPGQFTSPPTALGGVVYVGSSVELYAVSEELGTVVWTHAIPTVHSSPAVSPTGVYVGGGWEPARTPSSTNTGWHPRPGRSSGTCPGGSRRTRSGSR
jgi:outer membrane protein assembly factor BamB